MNAIRSRTSPRVAASRKGAASLADLFVPVVFLLLPGCAPTLAIQEVRVNPDVVCPCEPIRVEVVFTGASRTEIRYPGDTLVSIGTWTPTAAVSVHSAVVSQACESGPVGALARNPGGAEVTGSASVTVVREDADIPLSVGPLCGADCLFTGYPPVAFGEDTYSRSLVVRRAVNASPVAVRLTPPGGTPIVAMSGEPFAGVEGLGLVGTWGVAAVVLPPPGGFRCTGCGDITPRPGTSLPPTVTVTLTVGCPAP
jgi:hypothetical protein